MPFTNPFANIFTQQTPAPAAPGTPGAPQPAAPAPSGDASIQAATPTPANTPAATPGTAPNGVVPAGEQKEVSPLDNYQDFWQNDPNAKPQAEFAPEQLDPAKLQEVVSKTNLTSVITPELQARINAGGDDAQVAMVEAMNTVAQQTLMQSTTVANKMIEAQVTKAVEAMAAKVPALVKAQNLTNNLHDQNPLFKDPAVAPIIEATTAQLQTKFPAASAQELTVMAQDYVKAMAESLNPTAPPKNPASNEVDWSSYLEVAGT